MFCYNVAGTKQTQLGPHGGNRGKETKTHLEYSRGELLGFVDVIILLEE